MQNSRNTLIHIQQNIFALKASFYTQQLYIYAASRIVFNQLQGNDILVNCQWSKFIQRTYIYSQKYNHSRQLYSFTESYSFQGNIFIQGKHIHSGKLYPFKEIYSFKEHIFVQVLWPHVHSRKLHSFNNVAFADIA